MSKELIINNLKYLKHELRQVTPTVALAFVTTEDMGIQGKGFKPPHYKYYYGVYEGTTKSIEAIMETGHSFSYINGRITL